MTSPVPRKQFGRSTPECLQSVIQLQFVDLNTAHVTLNQLKIAAVRHLPGHDRLHRSFVEADNIASLSNYQHLLRDLIGCRQIGGFSKGIYKRGLLGNFIGLATLLPGFTG